jgi:hypothetical protein
VDDAVGGRVGDDALAIADRALETRAPEVAVGLDVFERDEPKRDLGRVGVEGAPERLAARIDDADDVPAPRLARVGDVAAVDPVVAPSRARRREA